MTHARRETRCELRVASCERETRCESRVASSELRDLQSGIWNLESAIRNPQSEIGNRKSEIGNRKSALRAFTLFELALTFFIVAVLLTVGVIRMGRTGLLVSESQRLARRLTADLRYAHSQAVVCAKNHYLLFAGTDLGYTSYAIYRDEVGGPLQVEPPRIIPNTVVLKTLSPRAEFTPGGSALSNYVYTISAAHRTYTVSVTLATGAVSLAEAPQ